MTYKEIIEKVNKGEILIGIEPAYARSFFSNIRKDKELKTKNLQKHSFVVNLLLAFSFYSLILLCVFAISLLKWYSILFIPITIMYFIYFQSRSSMGRQKIIGPIIYLIVCYLEAFKHINGPFNVVGFFLLLPLPFISTRMMYYYSCSVLRNLVMKNELLFNRLYQSAVFLKYERDDKLLGE
ncbi:MAG: hypothetical protein GX962_03770 [Epulopiscium sp.]|nr:hypothetical protein [Candidatus Epulonipiscium sp.]